MRLSSAVALIDCLLLRGESCGPRIGQLLWAYCSRVSPLAPEEPPELHVLDVENVPKQAASRAVVRGALESEKTSSQSQSGHRGSDGSDGRKKKQRIWPRKR